MFVLYLMSWGCSFPGRRKREKYIHSIFSDERQKGGFTNTYHLICFLGGTVAKKPPASARDIGGTGSIPVSGRSFGEGNGNPLQYSCLENSMDRGAWQATVYESRGVGHD